jgi:ppGpp synthetase/RelA/SpoT-type nucleotidyltranferase
VLSTAVENDILAHYESELVPKLETFAKGVADELRSAQVARTEVRPLIVWRVKTPESLRRKLRERFANSDDIELTRSNLIENVQDLAGVRVIVHDRSQIDRMIDVVEHQVKVGNWRDIRTKVFAWNNETWDEQEREGLQSRLEFELVKRGSYRSRHIIVGQGAVSPTRCEIQFRSVIEEAMFEAHHRLLYRMEQEGLKPAPRVEEMLGPMTELFSSLDDMVSDFYTWTREHHETLAVTE